ncbi:MAG: hypothetical protein LBK42_04625 [Propionibacteriaceae bacterium]|jgi:sec-independent protein translocase protein TatB|nr:hypothetical protein [Propionibacteriaceae bacterium]
MELFGINSAEFVVLLVLAVIVIGPKGLVQAFKLFRRALAAFRAWSAKLRQGTNLAGIAADLKLDPAQLDWRQYDPRVLVRQTVREEMDAWAKQAVGVGSAPTSPEPAAGEAAGEEGGNR